MTGRTNIHEIPETTAVFERQLNDGSRLEYRMQVLQQPERARACGQGAKCTDIAFDISYRTVRYADRERV
jgi:hypothetical protein